MNRRVVRVRPAGTWPAADAEGTVTFAFEERHRRRIRLLDDAGEAFLLDLNRATQLCDGDGLELDDGGLSRLIAAAETMLEVRAEDPRHLARLAWHIGNRHVALQVFEDGSALRLRDARVLETMMKGLGAELRHVHAPFSPESGAYSKHHGHSHDALGSGGHRHDDSTPLAHHSLE